MCTYEVGERTRDDLLPGIVELWLERTPNARAFALQDDRLLATPPIGTDDVRAWFQGNPNKFGLNRIRKVAEFCGCLDGLPELRMRDLEDFLEVAKELAEGTCA
jgi:hypothetical protein